MTAMETVSQRSSMESLHNISLTTSIQTGLPQVVEEVVNGAVTRQYTYGLQRISENQSINGAWTTSFYVYDGAGSVRQLANYNGAVTDEYGTTPLLLFHKAKAQRPTTTSIAGSNFDSDLGCITSAPDTTVLAPEDSCLVTQRAVSLQIPATLHKYFYASGDPVNRIDPSGRMDGATAGPMPSTAGMNMH